jgi:hypothetical protein
VDPLELLPRVGQFVKFGGHRSVSCFQFSLSVPSRLRSGLTTGAVPSAGRSIERQPTPLIDLIASVSESRHDLIDVVRVDVQELPIETGSLPLAVFFD